MTWLALLISGVLLNQMDMPMPKYHILFSPGNGGFKLVELLTTDKDGKFSVDLAPGTYRFQIRLNITPYTYYPGLDEAQTITVDKKTTELKLKLKMPEELLKPEPHIIEVVPGTIRIP